MSNAIFVLTYGDKGSFQDGPVLADVRIPLDGHGTKTVKKKAEVFPGMLVADHSNAKTGDMHATITGVVTEVTPTYVAVKAQEPAAPAEGEEAKPTDVESVSVSSLTGDELTAALKGLGVDTRPLLKRCDTLIINGLNPEPGVTYAEGMLANHAATLKAGLAVLKQVSPASKVVLALPEGATAPLDGVETAFIKAVYPNSLDEMLTVAVTGKESMKGVNVIGVHTLFNLGRVAESGKPLTETVVSVQGVNYMVKVGTPVGALIKHVGLEIADGDMVVLGGPMRGVAISDLNRGIAKDTNGLFVIKAGTFPTITNDQCISCGECGAHCPARIRPNMISRYVEFSDFDSAKKESIDVCMECGLCSYYCITRRPVLQIIRLGKHQIALEEAQVTACALQGEE